MCDVEQGSFIHLSKSHNLESCSADEAPKCIFHKELERLHQRRILHEPGAHVRFLAGDESQFHDVSATSSANWSTTALDVEQCFTTIFFLNPDAHLNSWLSFYGTLNAC